MSSRDPSGRLGKDGDKPVADRRQSYADRYEAPLSVFRSARRTQGVVARAVRMANLTVADALYVYGVTGSAFATVMMLAAPHLEVFARCLFQGKG
jgi:hypothetical protein